MQSHMHVQLRMHSVGAGPYLSKLDTHLVLVLTHVTPLPNETILPLNSTVAASACGHLREQLVNHNKKTM